MKEQKRAKRTIAAILVGIMLLMMVPLPVTAFADGGEVEAAPASASDPEPAPASDPEPAAASDPEPAAASDPAPAEPAPEAAPADSSEEPALEEPPAAEEKADSAAAEELDTPAPGEAAGSAEPEKSEPDVAEGASKLTESVQTSETPAASAEKEASETADPSAEEEPGKTEPAAGGFSILPTEAEAPLSGEMTAENAHRSAEIQVGDHIITAYGDFPEGTEIQAVELPRDAAAQMAGKAALFAYDIRLIVDGQVWQPEEHGTDVQISVRSMSGDLDDVVVDLLHVKRDLINDEGALSRAALDKTLQNMTDGSAESETLNTRAGESGFSFETSSFSAFLGTTNSRVVYVYNATLFNDDSKNYAGVYSTKLETNTATAEQAKTTQTIGIESIADKNLENTPTTESPAIIQGAAVGYEKRLGPTEYELLDPSRPRPEPYSEFEVKITEEQGADGTVHKKPSGFDGTYVIVRLDVSNFLTSGTDDFYLHMEQKDNKALMPAATIAKGTANAKVEDYTPTNSFTDGLGNRSASYKLSELVDKGGTVPYVDVIVLATAANVSGADTASTVQGDIPLAFYVDRQREYNSELKEYDPNNTKIVDPNDANAKTAYDKSWHAKFFDESKISESKISHYVIKGSDLALETMVEDSGGANNSETTYWSLKKSMENSYYDQEIDKDPNDSGSGKTVKLMSEVAVTNGLTLEGSGADSLKKRTLDVNSYDIQVANNSGTEGSAAEDITLKNAWLTIADYSNTTGAEMAIGNNAQFVIDQGGKLIIDSTCQLEIEWDGATTTPGTSGQETQPSILNNGQLDLRAGGEIVNNGIITIEGTEGKPIQPGTGTEQQQSESEKGRGEMAIREGATLTNNGALVIYGALSNRGTLVNNGHYNDVIKSNDPDKGAFDYHKGIQVAWKDDVTQKNIEAGSLTNEAGATLINNGDIVLVPGTLENKGVLVNAGGANIYSSAVTEAIIPITPDPATPTVVSKRVTLSPIKLSNLINSGTMINNSSILPATVALLDNTGGFSTLTSPGTHPELFSVRNSGVVFNYGYIYNQYPGNIVNSGTIYWLNGGSEKTSESGLLAALVGSIHTENDLWLYLYEDGSFLMILPNGERLTGTFAFTEGLLVFTFADGTLAEPAVEEDGNAVYSITAKSGFSFEFVLTAGFLAEVRTAVEAQR